jgi:hypothetical protein
MADAGSPGKRQCHSCAALTRVDAIECEHCHAGRKDTDAPRISRRDPARIFIIGIFGLLLLALIATIVVTAIGARRPFEGTFQQRP